MVTGSFRRTNIVEVQNIVTDRICWKIWVSEALCYYNFIKFLVKPKVNATWTRGVKGRKHILRKVYYTKRLLKNGLNPNVWAFGYRSVGARTTTLYTIHTHTYTLYWVHYLKRSSDNCLLNGISGMHVLTFHSVWNSE